MPAQLLHQICLSTEAHEQLLALLLRREDCVLVRRIGADKPKILIAESFNLLDLRSIFLRIDVLGIVGNPRLAALVERLLPHILNAVGHDYLIAIDRAIEVCSARKARASRTSSRRPTRIARHSAESRPA